jgi:hypothetical protein
MGWGIDGMTHEERVSPEFPITVRRGLLTDLLAVLDSAKTDRYTIGETARVLNALRWELERAARAPDPEAEIDS